jgi:UDP-N-acetylglucosamine 3-dehydrogenase
VNCLRNGQESQMNARNALRATEQIFAAWESARRRGLVRLPLEIDDNPLEAMVAAGELRPTPAE